ncbi:coenzyme F420-0:L-glutamate ligase [Sphingomonas sp. BIUV-7]|uniref:Coenzyme F420-0:L-glutamate ligase n=1 Tax=Sphingomonas natans TaxID=3063330 RepID=A0ABT8Y9G8_9SPHN|nr:coenzyme F420-0:L-glutamate ligase [Sphingomonas sp. BIUV-7]MDO6414478.1 coenzyme F420-0:L-glutamate ligase [Sphingomonas sp. BIUV-7]
MVGSEGLRVFPVTGIGEIKPGDGLAAIIANALAGQELWPVADDVLVVTSKIVSKAEGRFASLAEVRPGAEALALAATTGKDPRLVELILGESSRVVRTAPNVLITRHRLGLIMANAGIDQSNIGPGSEDRALLLPTDPDKAAAALSEELVGALGFAPAIIISDSFGRPWRQGVVNVAIGSCGFPSLVDRRGAPDRDGRLMQVTQIALADMVAAAAGLVTGEGDEGVPVAIVRGLPATAPIRPASALLRPADQDLFG